MNPGKTHRALFALAMLAAAAACGVRGEPSAAATEAPPAPLVDHETDGTMLQVDRPERFALVTAGRRDAAPELTVTGAIAPDVSRTVPVVSLATGRVVEIRARLGDTVTKGQLLLRIQSGDVSGALADYRKATSSQTLVQAQLDRSQSLYERGAVAKKDLELAEDAAVKAAVDVTNSADRLHLLGVNPEGHSDGLVDVVAPTSGVITEQNVTASAGVRTLDNSPNLFTIADLSHVWILCDVYESDLAALHEGDAAEIQLAAFPERTLSGRINNIGPILDPSLRTAKVRVEVVNPGLLRVGMFVTATFRGRTAETRTVVPATAVLHLHDRESVYVAGERGQFRRVDVVTGRGLSNNMQEIVNGIRPGERVVANALVFQNAVEQ